MIKMHVQLSNIDIVRQDIVLEANQGQQKILGVQMTCVNLIQKTLEYLLKNK